MQETLIRVPTSVSTDSDIVREALAVATISWEAGDAAAAVRWVRRAAEAADADGDIVRMAALARAAAEIEQARSVDSQMRAKTPPPAPPSVPPASRRTLKPTALPRSSSIPPPAPKPPVPASSKDAPAPKPARVRVSVRTSVRDTTLLVVRLLPEGQPLPEGAREAFLVMADGEQVDLASSKRSSVG
jgi:hypothetical protein